MGQLCLRLKAGERRRFHPKVYIFRGADRSVAWIGSANFTCSGFGGNEEVLFETSDTKAVEDWFKRLWGKCVPLNKHDINDYKNQRKRNPPQSPRKPWLPPWLLAIDKPPPMRLLEGVDDWGSYVVALEQCDWWWRRHPPENRWSVLGETHSYLHTICAGRKVAQLPDWRNLKQDECDILRGVDQKEGTWALLGDLKRNAAYVFNSKHSRIPRVICIRMQIREQVCRVRCASPREIAAVAHDAMKTIRKLEHKEKAYRPIGPAAATRLLTLARPDYLVSVNSASAAGLEALSGLNSPADNYGELLNWVHKQPWFNARQPDSLEQRIWDCRAALLDAFVYQPTR